MKLPLVKYTYTQCSVKFQIPDSRFGRKLTRSVHHKIAPSGDGLFERTLVHFGRAYGVSENTVP
jgi:hypothetical protein